ncbi:pyridoxal phosphate-dependent decarboxylase family protein [Treponema brennaborense]|uniref:Diaminobutyrate decarboxylase n=1 Tax=Treponema brennaborense (strain DSM 12168 / CIP 105900 / DD5/3) TaxID=906968 RepID=F4LKA6_TREBD|nr:aspartate aminotransferase family protein [Treponema brennaborense]AEE15495.1 Diaminobutyrate decarboxylase [Treponema brennaborense DSM 12168]
MPAHNDQLFLTDSPESKRAYAELLHKTIDDVAAAVTDGKAYAGLTPQELKQAIHTATLLPETGCGLSAASELLRTKILPYFLRTASTDYMAHLHSPALIETVAAELALATFNQSMDSWDQSPVATEIELEVVKELCRLYGYGDSSDGVFTSGGSQSNLSGIMLARDRYCNKVLGHDVKKYGLPENYRKFRLYTSEIAHFSMEKSAHLLGLGYDAVVKVPVDERQKMDVAALRRLVAQDAADGNLPFCAVATIGTTDYGSIDDAAAIHAVCAEYGMWLHADAAYGSGVVMSARYRSRIGNLNLCDSITVDFHKMFVMPVSCGAFLLKDGRNFEALTLHADYLNREEDEEDGYTNLVGKSMQTTRRFDALKVWIAFQTRGRDGWSNIISACMENAAYLYGALRSDPEFQTVTAPEISSVVFRRTPDGLSAAETDALNKAIRRTLIHKHGVVIGQTVFAGATYLKFTLLNPLVTHEKLDSLLALIRNLADTCRLSR